MTVLGRSRPREWETIWDTLTEMESLFSADPEGTGLSGALSNTLHLLRAQFTRADAGQPAVWYNLGFNPELLWALGGVNPFCVSEAAALSSIRAVARIAAPATTKARPLPPSPERPPEGDDEQHELQRGSGTCFYSIR